MALPIKTVPFYMTKKEYIAISMTSIKPYKFLFIPAYGIIAGAVLYTIEPSVGIAVGTGLLAFGILLPIARWRNFVAAANKPESQWAFEDTRTVEFSQDYLIMEMSNGFANRIPWKLFHKAEVRNDSLILALASQTLIVPVRVLGSPDERLEILELLKSKGLMKGAPPVLAETAGPTN